VAFRWAFPLYRRGFAPAAGRLQNGAFNHASRQG
jgi:hypothetical protein